MNQGYRGWHAFLWISNVSNSLDIYALYLIREAAAHQQRATLDSRQVDHRKWNGKYSGYNFSQLSDSVQLWTERGGIDGRCCWLLYYKFYKDHTIPCYSPFSVASSTLAEMCRSYIKINTLILVSRPSSCFLGSEFAGPAWFVQHGQTGILYNMHSSNYDLWKEMVLGGQYEEELKASLIARKLVLSSWSHLTRFSIFATSRECSTRQLYARTTKTFVKRLQASMFDELEASEVQ